MEYFLLWFIAGTAQLVFHIKFLREEIRNHGMEFSNW